MLLHLTSHTLLWLVSALVILGALGRTLWVYRGSSEWPIADGTIMRIDVEERREAGGHYVRATFTYEFHDLEGGRKTGTWYKNFSREPDALDFGERELPIGKQVLVRFNPKDPGINNLELDSSTYPDDRPTSLGL